MYPYVTLTAPHQVMLQLQIVFDRYIVMHQEINSKYVRVINEAKLS